MPTDNHSRLVAEANYADVFAALAEMTRGFVKLAEPGGRQAAFIAFLDSCLENGWVLRTQFAIGSAGALVLLC